MAVKASFEVTLPLPYENDGEKYKWKVESLFLHFTEIFAFVFL